MGSRMHLYRLAAIPIILLLAQPAGWAQSRVAEPQQEKPRDAVRITLERKASVRSNPSDSAEVVQTLDPGDTIYVTAYHPKEKYYAVRIGERQGYVRASEFKSNPALEELKEKTLKDPQRIGETPAPGQAGAAPKGLLDNETAKRQFLTMRYGARIANAVMKHEVWEGMTKEMVLLSLGKPKSVVRRVFSNLIKEQWEYDDGLYLFFDNDLLKSHGGPPWSTEPPPLILEHEFCD